ncbi:MAG TPA: hypothetical protein VMI72_18050 [Roseiarcus sp.]|nr:hypothetical protein [Roseiarcus sp.]
MEGMVQILWRRLSDLVEAFFHLPFAKLVGSLLALALLPLIISALPEDRRRFVKAALLGACGVIVILELVAPIDWSAILG